MTAPDRADEVARLLLEHAAATARVDRDPHSQYDRDEQREAYDAILAIVRELEARASELHEIRMLAYDHGYVGVTLGDEESRGVSVLEWLRFRLKAYDRMVTRLVQQNSKETP